MKKTPILLRFDDAVEFEQVMKDNAYTIHGLTFYLIRNAYENNDDSITLAYLNNHDTLLTVDKDSWLKNLECTLDFFISLEEYEKCQKIKDLMDKLK